MTCRALRTLFFGKNFSKTLALAKEEFKNRTQQQQEKINSLNQLIPHPQQQQQQQQLMPIDKQPSSSARNDCDSPYASDEEKRDNAARRQFWRFLTERDYPNEENRSLVGYLQMKHSDRLRFIHAEERSERRRLRDEEARRQLLARHQTRQSADKEKMVVDCTRTAVGSVLFALTLLLGMAQLPFLLLAWNLVRDRSTRVAVRFIFIVVAFFFFFRNYG
jgi:hypothetical protein